MLLCPPPSRFVSQPRPRRPIASRHMRSWALSKLKRNTDSQFVLYRPQGRIVAPYYVLPPSLSFSSFSENGRLLLPKRPHAHTHTHTHEPVSDTYPHYRGRYRYVALVGRAASLSWAM